MWGVRGRALSHPRPHVRPGVRPRPLLLGAGVAGVRTRHQPHSARSSVLRGRHVGAQGGRLLPNCGASGVGRSPDPDHPSFRACARARFPLVVGAVCGRGGRAVLGNSSRAAVRRVLCALPGFAAPGGRCGSAPVLVPWLWPAACLSGVPRGPALVRRSSSGLVARGAPVGFLIDVVPPPTPGAVAQGFTGWLRGARGGRPRTGLIVPSAGPCRGKGAGRAPRCTRSGPHDEFVPGGSLRLRSWAACAAVVWRVWTRSLTRPASRTVRLATGDSAGAQGLFRVDADTAPFRSEDATPRSRGCVRVRAPLGRIRQAGLLGAFWCASPFYWPFLVRSLLVRPPLGWGCPVCGCCGFFSFLFFLVPLSPPRCALVVSCFACLPAPGALDLGVLSPPPPFFLPPPPVVSGVSCFPVAWGLCPPPPPPFFFVLCFLFFLFPFFFPFFFASCAVWGGFVCLGPSGVPPCASVVLSLSLLCVRWLVLRGGRCWDWLSSAVSWLVLMTCFGGAVLVWPRGSPPCGLAWCVLVFRLPVLRSVALCCRVVVCCRALPFVCVLACACCLFLAAARLLCVFWGVVLCVPCPLRPVRCCAALCGCPFVVLCASSVLFLVAGVVDSWCRCLLLRVCWWLWLPGVVVWWCVSALVPVSGLAVARRLPCGVLLPCAVSCGAVLPCGAVLWCPVFFFLFFSLLVALVSCCSRLVLGSGPGPGCFCFCALPVRCCACVPASLLSVRCSLALAGLAGSLCCFLLCLCVCC